MDNVYLFYPQYQEGSGKYTSHWLPYTITALWSYVDQFNDIKENFTVKDIIFSRDPVDSVVNSLENPALCLFSTYTWNHNYNRTVAKAIKEKYPDCCIVFGGPQIPATANQPEEEYVDSYVVKEGEYSLLQLLRDFRKGHVDPVYRLSKRTEIEHSPSPYVDNDLMDRIVQAHPETKWAMVMETNRGCPFGCTFCDWGGLTEQKIKRYNLQRVLREIDWLCDNHIEYVYIADANYGAMYDRDLEITNYIAKKKRETGYPYVVNVNWYKNSTKRIITLNKIFESVGLSRGMTLSVQSLNDSVLANIKRDNMGINNLENMYAECNKSNVRFYTEFIMGLPGETLDSFKRGISRVIDLGCHTTIDVYPFEMMPNAPAQKQIEEFGLELHKYPAVIPNQPTVIPEYFNIVKGTKHMPTGDIVQAWVWAWVVHNMHYYNWSQFLCRFVKRHLGVDAQEFYNELWNDVVIRNNFISNEYIKRRGSSETILFSDSTENSDILSLTHYADQHIWHDHRDSIYSDIQIWAERYLQNRYGIKPEILTAALEFNRLYNVNPLTIQPTVVEFEYNIYDYVVHNKPLKQQPTVYKFENKIPWDDRNEFDMLVYRRHTYGFSQRQVTVLANDEHQQREQDQILHS